MLQHPEFVSSFTVHGTPIYVCTNSPRGTIRWHSWYLDQPYEHQHGVPGPNWAFWNSNNISSILFMTTNHFLDGRILGLTEGRNSLILHSKISLTRTMSIWILRSAVCHSSVCAKWSYFLSCLLTSVQWSVDWRSVDWSKIFRERENSGKRCMLLNECKTFRASVTNNPGLLRHDTILLD